MMLKFKINCALSGWQDDLFNLFLPRNLVNLSDVLKDGSVRELPTSYQNAPDGRSDSRISARAHGGACANPHCAFHGTSGTARQLGGGN
jgi:hypothetical protein